MTKHTYFLYILLFSTILGWVVSSQTMTLNVLAQEEDTTQSQTVNEEKLFSHERARESLRRFVTMHEAHERLQDAFLGKSNLRDFDPGTNDNPYNLLGNGSKFIPDNAIITLSITKQELIDLRIVGWEGMVIGYLNNRAYIEAWIEYQLAENARLRLELFDIKSSADSAERTKLQEKYDRHRKAVSDYLNSPGAD